MSWASYVMGLFQWMTLNLLYTQASFLILIAAFLSPPAEPFAAVFEREMLILFFSTLGWAYVSSSSVSVHDTYGHS
jgi:hypothetical protein